MNILFGRQLFPSISELTPVEQARAIAFLGTFQDNPAHPSISLERLSGSRSANLWSARITRDLRAILFKDGDTWAILYAGHHDAAYDWAERREVGRNAYTGALELVDTIETIRQVERVIEVAAAPIAPRLFAAHEDAYLLSLGLPENWLPTLRRITSDDQLLGVCEKLPPDLAERLLAVASGELVTPPTPVPMDRSPLEAPDTHSTFYLANDADELKAALRAPLARWIGFLHPSQRALVQRRFNGPSKVSGSAGTGKTVVAMHRARQLARKGDRVLLTSFVSTLCSNIERNLDQLCAPAERSSITVSTVHKQALQLVRAHDPQIRPASNDDVTSLLTSFALRFAPAYDASFVHAEWDHVVRLQGVQSWDEYRVARRTGRGRGLSVKERKVLWAVFGGVLDALEQRGTLDWAGLCIRARELLLAGSARSPFDAVIVDEVQDLRPPDLRFLAALCAARPENLMLCGDAGQRIYPGGFSLSALGIDVRGRSSILRINYRTTEQIRRAADALLSTERDDMDGGRESRTSTRSLLGGPEPVFRGAASRAAELDFAVEQIQRWINTGRRPDEIGVFARTGARVKAIVTRLRAASLTCRELSHQEDVGSSGIGVGTMHRAKGLEFKTVLVVDCTEGVLPSRSALNNAVDPQDLEAAESRERHLLYVAMTRARDELVVTWSGQPTRFLAGLGAVASIRPVGIEADE